MPHDSVIRSISKALELLRRTATRLLVGKSIGERECPRCERPIMDYPEQRPDIEFREGNCGLLIYLGKKNSIETVRFRLGVWFPGLNANQFGQLFSKEDIPDLLELSKLLWGIENGRYEVIEKKAGF